MAWARICSNGVIQGYACAGSDGRHGSRQRVTIMEFGWNEPVPNALGCITQGQNHMKTARVLVGVFLLGLSSTAALALDASELAPCRPAAARFCDRSEGMTFSNLLRCGATLAAHSFHVGNACRDVLKRYGQL